MSSQIRAEGASSSRAPAPLFYREPVPLSSQAHATWRLNDGDLGFAADTPFVPIVAGEVAAAARSYPIVFAADDAQPVAIFGLERANLFVEQGGWVDDNYVPAYIRRYPFGFIATRNPDGFALAIDGASDRVLRDGDAGIALFEDGEASALTRHALAFCDAFQADAAATRAFADALKTQGLLTDRRADATLPDGRALGIDGFQIVDAQKLAELAEAVVIDWHRNGYLALIHAHLFSLDRFQALLARQARRDRGVAEGQDDVTASHAANSARSTPPKPLVRPLKSKASS